MSYSQFSINQIKSEFGITFFEEAGIFANISEASYSDFLAETLEYNIPLRRSNNRD